jgi:DNA modification methylase
MRSQNIGSEYVPTALLNYTRGKSMIGFNYVLMTGAAEDRLKSVPSNSVDMILTSPPYDGMRDYQGHTFNEKVFRKIARELKRVLKDGGTLVWVVGDQTKNGTESFTSLRQALYFKDNLGLNAHDTMIYHRKGPPLTHNRYEQAWEYMFVFTKGRPKTFNGMREPKEYAEKKPRQKAWSRWADGSHKINGNNTDTDTRLRYNLWYYPMGHVAEERFAHQQPAIFPEALAQDHIYTWSVEGDIVLDPFCGSGTTGKMALKMGRKFIGIEISEAYMAIAKQRIDMNRDKRRAKVMSHEGVCIDG